MTEQAKFAYSPLGKAFEKQTKRIEDHGVKKVESLKALKSEEELESIKGRFPKDMRTNEIKMKYMKTKNWKNKLNEKI